MHESPSIEIEQESLSQALHRLLETAQGGPMLVREVMAILHGRGLQVVIIFLCLPFLTPVAIPGISIPFGLAIALSGVRLAFSHKPWLPEFILNRKLSYTAIERIVRFGSKLYGRIEKVIKPRYLFLLEGNAMNLAIGMTIAFAGVLLSLPIPPPFPFTNMIPGFAIILLSLGIMERDGVLIVLGYILTVVAAVYIGAIILLGKAGAMHLWNWITEN